MRITSGSKRGTILRTPEGLDTRPTLDKIKQAIFNSIQFEIMDKKVLDLFAGSGQMGLEALSRGAAFCFFNDGSKRAAEVIDYNRQKCGSDAKSFVFIENYDRCLSKLQAKGEKIDIVFLDPPYGKNLINNSLQLIIEFDLLNCGAIVVCESGDGETLNNFPELTLLKEKIYGKTKTSILTRK